MTEQDAADAVPDDEQADEAADADATEVTGGSDDADAADTEGDAGTGPDEETGGADTGASAADIDKVLDDAVDDLDAEDDAGADVEDVNDELVERVADADPESVARELAALRVRVDALEGQLAAREEEVEDLTSKLRRKQADFQNYKKRMEKRREEERQRATEDLVERLLDVRDNLVRALEQDGADAADIRDGVESTLDQFDRVLDGENVEVVEPDPGDAVDPHTHEVLMRVESDQPEDAIADVHRPGYVMADKVLRPAQVTVSTGDGTDDGNGGAGDDSEGGTASGDGTSDDGDGADDGEN